MKILILTLALFGVAYGNFNEEALKELQNEYRDFIREKINERIHHDGTKPSMEHCTGAGIDCEPTCLRCFPGGWCVKNSDKCLCNYGWTGPYSYYKEDTSNAGWGKNRILADDCHTACHYTHVVRNQTCVGDDVSPHPPHPICDKDLCEGNKRGKCVDGLCKCCKGWSGDNAVYGHFPDHYYTTGTCDKVCPYLGPNIPNPTCKEAPLPVTKCNPKCGLNGGECNKETGRCLCCEGWTGSHARFEDDGRISTAGYCDVYCPYTIHEKNQRCVNPDYVERIKNNII